jgi:hypothetical protein
MDGSNQDRDDITDLLKIANPCPVLWEHMCGDDRIRTCDSCCRKVFNISSMTRNEARLLARSSDGSLCVRINVSKDGVVSTLDSPDPRKPSSFHFRKSLAILSALLFGLFFVGCRKPVNKQDMLLQSEKGSLTPRNENGYTIMGTVTPRIAIPPEEDETSVSVLELP